MKFPRRLMGRIYLFVRRISSQSNSFSEVFESSPKYWEERYRKGGNSGSGSYGELALYKAEFLKTFLKDHAVGEVIEFGCGDGNQLSLVSWPRYTGVDISETVILRCKQLFANHANLSFYTSAEFDESLTADLTLSLDVIYHLVEDSIFEKYMEILFSSSRKFVIIYSSNFDSQANEHVRHRKFTNWIESNMHNFELIKSEENPFASSKQSSSSTSSAKFYVFQNRLLNSQD